MAASREQGTRLASHDDWLGALAQLGERNTGSVEVSGSIPLGSTSHQLIKSESSLPHGDTLRNAGRRGFVRRRFSHFPGSSGTRQEK